MPSERRHPLVDHQHGHHRGRHAAHRADRQVDLAEQQHQHDAERDDADRGGVLGDRHDVARRQEPHVVEVEPEADDDQPDDDRQVAEVAGAEPGGLGPQVAAEALGLDQPLVGEVGGDRRRGRLAGLGVSHRCRPPPSCLPCGRSCARGGPGRPGGHDVVGRAGDGRDQLRGGGLLDPEVGGVAAQPQHHDPVGDRLDVGHVVADQDHAEPGLAEPLDEVEDLGGLGDAQRGGRLVEHDHLGLADQAAGDRHGLALAARERGDRDPHRGDLGRQRAQQPPRLLLHLDLVEDGAAAVLLPEEQVGDDVEVVAQGEVLEDRGDAQSLGLGTARRSRPACRRRRSRRRRPRRPPR